MMRFLLVALAVFAIPAAIGLSTVDNRMGEREISGEFDQMTYAGRLRAMDNYETPTDYAQLWTANRR